jgi:hypothetical protein
MLQFCFIYFLNDLPLNTYKSFYCSSLVFVTPKWNGEEEKRQGERKGEEYTCFLEYRITSNELKTTVGTCWSGGEVMRQEINIRHERFPSLWARKSENSPEKNQEVWTGRCQWYKTVGVWREDGIIHSKVTHLTSTQDLDLNRWFVLKWVFPDRKNEPTSLYISLFNANSVFKCNYLELKVVFVPSFFLNSTP